MSFLSEMTFLLRLPGAISLFQSRQYLAQNNNQFKMKKWAFLFLLFPAFPIWLRSQCTPMCATNANSKIMAINASGANQEDSITIRYIDPLTKKEVVRKANSAINSDLLFTPKVQVMAIQSFGKQADASEQVHTIHYEDGSQSSFRLWKDGVIPYEFASNHAPEIKTYIETIMQYVQTNTNVCFRERIPDVDNDYLRIISKSNIPGKSNLPAGYSYIGRIGGGQDFFINEDFVAGSFGGTIVHELCHAIGLPHEHQLPIRDMHIKVEPDNICDEFIGNFIKITQLPHIYYADYEIKSIMHYRPCAGSKNGKYVFTCVDYAKCPDEVGQRTRLDIKDVLNINKLYPVKGCAQPTLMLMDVSGSMNDNNKYAQARASAQNTIKTIEQEAQQAGKSPEIGLMVFSGECVANPTTLVLPFTTDLDQVRSGINLIPLPNGRTPLPQAVEQAVKTLEARLAENGQTCGDLILLGDGQSTCGNVRPPGAYAGVWKSNKCVNAAAGMASIRMFTVGFGIAPGSEAELDLQYLAATSGGKYFNAQDEYQLTRSFQKINRIYVPIPRPQTKKLPAADDESFSTGVSFVYSQEFDTAYVLFKNFFKTYPTDSAGIYNLALMCEATERYKAAARYYELYLQHAPNDPNRAYLQEKAKTMLRDYEIFVAYVKTYLQSDLAFLERHYQQLLNTPNAAQQANEFAGFILEKYRYYQLLPEMLEREDAWLKQYSKEICQGLRECAYYVHKKLPWDMTGIAKIGYVYEPLKRMVKQLGN